MAVSLHKIILATLTPEEPAHHTPRRCISDTFEAVLCAEALSNYEAKLTAGYSETYTQSDSSSVAVEVPDGHHGTLTKGAKF